jgi:tetratricopeptide (TPR) repeat protein
MNSLTLIFTFCFFSIGINGQQHVIDSLKKLVPSAKEDTNRVRLLHSISVYYDESDSDSSIRYEQLSLQLAKKLNFKNGEIRSISHLGFLAMTKGNYSTALDFLFQAKKYNDVDPPNHFGTVINQNIGLVYFYMSDFKNAKDWLLKAKASHEALNAHVDNYFIPLNLARAYLKLNNLDSALLFISEAQRTNNRMKSLPGRSSILLTLGEIHEQQGHTEISLEFYKQAIAAALNENGKRALIRSYQAMSNFYFKRNILDSTLAYGRIAVIESKKAGYNQHLMESAALISRVFEKRLRYDSAFFYLSISAFSRDEMYSQEKLSTIQNLTFSEILRDFQDTQKQHEAQITRNKNLQNIFIAIGLSIFIVLFLLLARSIIVEERLIKFLGAFGLIMMFEFINLLVHPLLERITDHTPFLILLAMVAIASVLVPVHHKIEHFIIEKIVRKNKQIRLIAAKKTIEQLEKAEMINTKP